MDVVRPAVRLALVNGDRPANPTPNFDAVFSWCCAGNIDGCPTFTFHGGLHDDAQQPVLHQVNASIPCDLGLKHDFDARGREIFDLRNQGVTGRTACGHNQRLQLLCARG